MSQKSWKEFEETISSDYDNTTGVVILKNDEAIYGSYFRGHTADNALHAFSVTGSILSALIGTATGRGYTNNADQKVLDFFPDYTVKGGEGTIQRITIQHLLTITAPYKYQAEPYKMFFASRNPIQDALDLLGGEKTIDELNYSATGGTHILSGILVEATGQPILDLATKNLFSPLGVRVPYNIVLRNREEHFAMMNDRSANGWVANSQRINTADWGLSLTPEGMVKTGQLYLNDGMWDQKRIVSAKWMTENTRGHNRCVQWSNPPYDYLWWIIGGEERTYAAMGDGGNVIYINAEKKMVVSIVSTFISDTRDQIELIRRDIGPMFEGCES